MELRNKVILITGSGGGIGRALALECCRLGASVMLNGRNPEKLEKTRQWFENQGFNVAAHVADVSDFGQCQNLVAATLAAFGGIDALVANAGVAQQSRFADMPSESLKAVLDSNLLGAVFTAQAALPALRASRGSLVFVGSVAGFYGLLTTSTYSAAKAGMAAFAQSLRAELEPEGMHVGIAYLGLTENDADKTMVGPGGLAPIGPRPARFQRTQAEAAATIAKMLLQRQAETTPGWMAKTIRWLACFAPGVLRWVAARQLARGRRG